MGNGDNSPNGSCFACGKKLRNSSKLIACQDDQTAYVGSECYRHIKTAGRVGWQPPKGGPRLYLLEHTGRIDPEVDMDKLQAQHRLPGVMFWKT